MDGDGQAMKRPPFDLVRAAFILVAAILAAHVVVVFVGVGMCVYVAADIVAGRFKCDADSKIFDLLSQALSAALAFAGGYAIGGKDK